MVVRTFWPWSRPASFLALMSRFTVQRATWMPWRCRWAHIFKLPYSDSGGALAVLAGLVVAGQQLGSPRCPQAPLRRRLLRPGVVGSRDDLAARRADTTDFKNRLSAAKDKTE